MSALHVEASHDCREALPRHAALDALSEAARCFFARLRAVVASWRRRARARAELAALDERTLADIGLSRAEAEFLINKPFWRE